MRTREEIEKKVSQFRRYFMSGDQVEVSCLTLELLLDIRDLLTVKPEPPPTNNGTPLSIGLFDPSKLQKAIILPPNRTSTDHET